MDRALGIGAAAIAAIIRQSTSGLQCFDRIMAAYRDRAGVPEKTAWAEKTPWNCASYDRLALSDEPLTFISLVRDPRDAATSERDGTYYQSPQVCLETLQLVQSFDAPNHLVVRYEDRGDVLSLQNLSDFSRKLLAKVEVETREGFI